jgi:hypothetical protein
MRFGWLISGVLNKIGIRLQIGDRKRIDIQMSIHPGTTGNTPLPGPEITAAGKFIETNKVRSSKAFPIEFPASFVQNEGECQLG